MATAAAKGVWGGGDGVQMNRECSFADKIPSMILGGGGVRVGGRLTYNPKAQPWHWNVFLTYRNGNPRKYDGRHKLPNPARKGKRQRQKLFGIGRVRYYFMQ